MRFSQTSVFLLLTLLPGLPAGAFGQSTPAKSTAAARPAATTPDPKKVPLIEEIFHLTKPEGMINGMLAQYKNAFQQAATQGFEQEVRKFDDPAKYRGDFAKLQDRVFALLSSRLDWQKMRPQFVQIYSDTFSVDELSGIAAFYRSPAGHAAIEKMPGLLQKCSVVSQQQVGNMGPEIQKMMTDFMNDIKKRSAASKPAPPPAK